MKTVVNASADSESRRGAREERGRQDLGAQS
jgi:hypothetical protein